MAIWKEKAMIFCCIFFFIIILVLLLLLFFSVLSGYSTCYDGAPLRSPALEKGVMLGVLPKQ